MTSEQVREYLNNGELDFEFSYAGADGAICLCYLPKIFVVYDGVESETTLPELMDTPFLVGKTLNETAEKIKFYG